MSRLLLLESALTKAEYDHHDECPVCRAGRPFHKEGCEIAEALGRRQGWYNIYDPENTAQLLEPEAVDVLRVSMGLAPRQKLRLTIWQRIRLWWAR